MSAQNTEENNETLFTNFAAQGTKFSTMNKQHQHQQQNQKEEETTNEKNAAKRKALMKHIRKEGGPICNEQKVESDSIWSMVWGVLCCDVSSSKSLMPASTLDIPNYNRDIADTEENFRKAGLFALVVYGFLVSFAYAVAKDSEEEISSMERSAARLGLVILAVTIGLQVMPLMMRNQGTGMPSIIFAAMVVQGIALCTSALMVFGNKPPIMIDAVTGGRVHLLRWAEWAPAAFVMTFLVEGADVPDLRYKRKPAYFTAVTQGISPLAGFLFPLCPSTTCWIIALAAACSLYFYILFRLRYKYARFQKIPRGSRLDQLEIYHRSDMSLRLLKTCAAGWTTLIGMFMAFSVLGPKFAAEDSLLRHPTAPMLSEAFLDVLLKVVYMSYIIQMHEKVFDDDVRAKRRLEELRQMMWHNSSDVLAISVESLSGTVTTMVSPTFVKMLRKGKVTTKSLEQEIKQASGDKGMTFGLSVIELQSFLDEDGHHMPQVQPTFCDFGLDDMASQSRQKKVQFLQTDIGTDEMEALAKLLARSWQCEKRDSLLTHNLVYREESGELGAVQCEARVTKLDESALFLVVRDISERFRRFEAEKRAVSEMTARRKDSEANRFTRHEVKNGLLAALGLCDSLNETLQENLTPGILKKIESSFGKQHAEELNNLFSVQDTVSRLVREMDTALHEVLDTILAEAMARDVIHEAYKPHLERMDAEQLLRVLTLTRCTEGTEKADRFPLNTSPDPFPTLLFDHQLLKCIHRNAVSNASKYGQKGEIVVTNLIYDEKRETLRLEVINKPGEKHKQLLQLGNQGEENVFSQGVRLHPNLQGGEKRTTIARHSSGDGAWIMQKCAKTLGGQCGIEFSEDRTVFSMCCPVTICHGTHMEGLDADNLSVFKFPKGTWGIAIDDSKIQRKLLKRILSLAGIEENRIIILGENSREITGFDDFVVDKVDNHPNDHFLLIVDENLDIAMDDLHENQTTISGSMLIQSIRHRMLVEQERQMLALVRSANDSSHDIAIYNSRTHGFMPKAPFKKSSVFEVIAPLWEARFNDMESFGDEMSECASVDSSPSGNSEYSLRSSESCLLLDESEGFADLIQEHVRAVDHAIGNEEAIASRWPDIWEKLHTLKGDLSSLNFPSEQSTNIVTAINGMRGKNLAVDFVLKWQGLRQLILQMCTTNEGMLGG